MATLYNNILALCERRGIKGGKMCADIGISKGLLTDLKMGRRSGVSAVTAQKIASYFDVSVAYLLGEEDTKKEPTVQDDGLSDDTREIMELLKGLSDEKARLLLPMIRAAVEAD